MRNLVAALLLTAGVVLGVVAWHEWQDETYRAAEAAGRNRYAAVFGNRLQDDQPDRSASFALGGLGAVLFLSGVIVGFVQSGTNE